VLTQSELSELERLRRQETAWRQTEAELRSQIAAQRTAAPGPDLASPAKTDLASADRTELDRLKSAEASWEREQAQLRQQVAAANDRATKAQAAENALRAKIDALQTADDFRRPDTTRPTDTVGVEQILREYEAAYERRDANAVVRLMPSASAAELSKSFSQVRAYQMEILDAKISVTGDTAVVNCVRRVSIEPRVGSRPPPRTIPTVMRLRQSQGAWIIDSVEERR
jgi:ketosteroid isomerase-like protein